MFFRILACNFLANLAAVPTQMLHCEVCIRTPFYGIPPDDNFWIYQQRNYCKFWMYLIIKFEPKVNWIRMLWDLEYNLREILNFILQLKDTMLKWDKVFKNGPSEICGIQSLKNSAWSILEYFVPNISVCESSKMLFYLGKF